MDPKTKWLSLIAGCLLFFYGIMKLYQEGDWTLFIIGILIIGFSASSMLKGKEKE